VAVAGCGHAQFAEQDLLGQILPGCLHRVGCGLAGLGEAKIAVVVTRPEGIKGLLAEVAEDVGTIESEVLQQITGTRSQSSAVGHQVSEGCISGDVVIVEREVLVVLDNGVCPFDDLLSHYPCHHGGGQGLGYGSHLEHGVRCDLFGLPDFPDPEAVGVHHLVPVHHGDSHSGKAGTFHGVLDELVKPSQGVIHFRPVQQWFDLPGRGREQ
jgi:hypothetical protein